MSFFTNPLATIDKLVWGDYFAKLGPLGRALRTVLQYLYALIRDVLKGELSLRSMSLVYTTLLSIVPLLAFSFSILKGFGVFDQLEPYLARSLEPLGEQGVRITETILGLVQNVRGSVLGGVSMIILLWTVISTIQKIESSFNYVWYVSKPRNLARRFTEYLVVLTVGPILMVVAITIIGSMGSNDFVQHVRSLPGVGETLLFAGQFVPYVIISGVFTFLYMFMPNTRVNFSAAAIGGLCGGALWATMAVIFTAFVVTAARTQNMYANFAVAIFALIWLYLNWLVLLVGAQIAFYYQNPAFLRIGRQDPHLSNSTRERLVLNVMYLVGKAFRVPGTRVNANDISSALGIPTIAMMPIATKLENAGLLVLTENEQWVPGREMSRIKVSEILAVVRSDNETESSSEPSWTDSINQLGNRIDNAVDTSVENETLADMLGPE